MSLHVIRVSSVCVTPGTGILDSEVMQMVLVNEIGDYDDIQSVLRGLSKEAPTWKVRPEWRDRVIGAFTIERTHWVEIESLIGLAKDEETRNLLARVYLEEEAHQAIFSSLMNSRMVPWQHIVGSELAFIAFVSVLAQSEIDPDIKAIFDYLIIDHLTHAKKLAYETRALGVDPDVIDEINRLPVGREMRNQFHATQDLINKPYGGQADPGTKVNIRLVLMAETIVRELLESLAIMGSPKPLARLARELAVVEAEHNLMLRSLLNPNESVLEKAFYSELAEIIGLNRLLAPEKESGAKDGYEFVIEEDEDHLRYLGELLLSVEDKDPGPLSESKAFTAKPRRTLENYLPQIIKEGIEARPSGRSSRAA